jgi:hypothetical protein
MVAFLAIAWLVALPTCWGVPSARPRYLMPLYPLAAPLVGLIVQRVFEAQAAAIVRRGWLWFVAAAKLSLVGAAVAVVIGSCGGVSHPLLAQHWGFAAFYVATAIFGLAVLVRNWTCWTPRAATTSILLLAALAGVSYAGLAVNALVALDPHADEQIARLKEQLGNSGRMVSFGTVETLFTYHWRDAITIERLSEGFDDLSAQSRCFCFNWNTAKPPLQLPFPWRMEAAINCDRTDDERSGKIVIVGRWIETVALAPGDTTVQR